MDIVESITHSTDIRDIVFIEFCLTVYIFLLKRVKMLSYGIRVLFSCISVRIHRHVILCQFVMYVHIMYVDINKLVYKIITHYIPLYFV